MAKFSYLTMIGRRTCVLRTTAVEGDSSERESESIVIKSSFTPKTGNSESNGEIFEDSIMRATNSNGVELCTSVHPEAFATDSIDAQCRLSGYTTSRDKKHKNHVLQFLVMTELFQMIDMTADTLIPVIKDFFKCCKWLYQTERFIHGNISENSLMYQKKVDGTICGVLSDYDLSSMLARQDSGPSSKQRTGTRPFMACDLLEPTPREHLYRHDLESLFYVIIVLMFRSQDKTLKEDEKFESFPALKHWFTLPPAQLLTMKREFFFTKLPRAPPAFKKLEVLVVKMKIMFVTGYLARSVHEDAIFLGDPVQDVPAFNESTLGGHVDFDKFQKILDSV